MSLFRKALALVFAVLLLNSVAWAGDGDELSSDECELLHHMKAPTVYGGTGLFNTYSTRTLNKGEMSVGFFWNNFDREPGAIATPHDPQPQLRGVADRDVILAEQLLGEPLDLLLRHPRTAQPGVDLGRGQVDGLDLLERLDVGLELLVHQRRRLSRRQLRPHIA